MLEKFLYMVLFGIGLGILFGVVYIFLTLVCLTKRLVLPELDLLSVCGFVNL